MLLSVSLLAASVCPGNIASPPTGAGQANRKLVATLRAWLGSYRQGKFVVGDDYQDIAGKSLVKRAGIITKAMFQRDNGVLKRGQFSYREEIGVLLDAASKVNTAACAAILLEYCAVGLDDVIRYSPGMVPFYVRGRAEMSLRELGVADTAWLVRIVAGAVKPAARKSLHPAIRAAAIRAIGRRGAVAVVAAAAPIRAALADPNVVVRLAATGVLGGAKDKANLASLVAALERERDSMARRHLHLWIGRLISSVDHRVDATLAKQAATLLSIDLVEARSWHTLAQLTELVPVHALPEYAGRLIDILARFQAESPGRSPVVSPGLEPGQLSGTLRHRVYEQLTKLTDSYYPIDDFDGWGTFWQREKAGFAWKSPSADDPEVAKKAWLLREAARRARAGLPVPAARATPQPIAGLNDGDCFGIPVRGSHVVFVVDTGYGMRQKTPLTGAACKGRWPNGLSRIEVAKLEVIRALRGLTADARFNVLAFSDRTKAAFKQPARASKRAVDKAIKFTLRLSPSKNYDLGAALLEALGIDRLRYVHRDTAVDEIFVVSNHMNQAGNIKAPDDLIALIAEISRFSQVRINTVYLGTVDDEDDKAELGLKTMQQIAELTGGQFIRP